MQTHQCGHLSLEVFQRLQAEGQYSDQQRGRTANRLKYQSIDRKCREGLQTEKLTFGQRISRHIHNPLMWHSYSHNCQIRSI